MIGAFSGFYHVIGSLMFGCERCEPKVQDKRVVLRVAVVAGASAGWDEAESCVESEGRGATGADFKSD